MNNNIKKLISVVLAISIAGAGTGIIGFADKVSAQAINLETSEIIAKLKAEREKSIEQSQEPTATSAVEQTKSCEVKSELSSETKSNTAKNKEFRPEEITLSVEAAHNPYLEQAVKDLNEFIKEYNSKATREEKSMFAVLKMERTSVRYDVFEEEFKRGTKGEFCEKINAETLKLNYICCCISENPYLADIMKEIAEIQTIYDSKLTNKAKRAFIKEELDKLKQNSGKEDNEAWRHANCVKIAYLRCLESALDTKNKDKNSVIYKIQKVIDNLILFAGKYIIFNKISDKVLGRPCNKLLSFLFDNGNPFLATLLAFPAVTALAIPVFPILFPILWPLNLIDALKKFANSIGKLF